MHSVDKVFFRHKTENEKPSQKMCCTYKTKNSARTFLPRQKETRTMAIVDVWHADDGYSVQGEELSFDVADWPAPDANNNNFFTLRLEELTQFEVEARIQARERNLIRLKEAKQRKDIQHVEVHYTGCNDDIQCQALHDLLAFDDREWGSFTLQGVNSMNDFYTKPTSLESLCSLFLALKEVKVLNLYSCSAQHRGHGLEDILKTIPHLTNLTDLRLHGWQMDRVSTTSLIESIQEQESKSIQLLSLRSCCFLGEDTFQQLVDGFGAIEQLHTVNLSYCSLRDNDITRLVDKLKSHPSLECLHIGGNDCISPDSVDAIAGWLEDESCKIRDLNLRALWIGFCEEGLMQRFVDLTNLFQSVGANRTLQSLTLSESYLENMDVEKLCSAVEQKDDLIYLDIGDNPFSESGAKLLLDLVRNGSCIESVRFENIFIPYKCAGSIKLLARWNYLDRRLVNKSANVPLSLWPQAFATVQSDYKGRYDSTDFSPDIIFRFLNTSSGEFGHPLSYRMANQKCSEHYMLETE
jgi:hypothetical protein